MANDAIVAEQAPKTVEIQEQAKPEAAALPTKEDLRAKGWTDSELESGEKRGMIAKPGGEPVKKDEAKPEAKAEEKPAEKPAKKPSSLPEFGELSPEKERIFTDTFGPGTLQRALYFRMKNERHARQASDARVRELQAQIDALKQPAKAAEPERDEFGKVIDPDNAPLTAKMLKEMKARELDEQRQAQESYDNRVATLKAANTEQEEYIRAEHPDFDSTLELASKVMNNVDELFAEDWQREEVIDGIKKGQVALMNADRLPLNGLNAARIAYNIGRLHPDWGKTGAEPEKTGAHKDPKANGGLKPEQMKRIEQNTQRRKSAAEVQSGGGRRTVSVDDVDLKTLHGMTYSERKAFKDKFPDRYAALSRG